MTGAHGRHARRMLIASAFLCLSAAVSAAGIDTIAAKQSLLRQDKSSASATNGILTVDYDTTSGRFSISTGLSNPNNPRIDGVPQTQTVFFPVGTSYITLRDATSQEIFINCGTNNPGISGYTSVTMCPTPPVVTPLGNGFRAVFTLANWIVQQDVEINGSTLADTNVRHKVTVTNTTHHSRDYGVRYLWDWMVAGNDSSYFRKRNPDGNYLGPTEFTNFSSPTFQLFEEVDNPTTPIFHVYGTVGGGSLIPTPTTPDEVRYASWGQAASHAWDFPELESDSATVHFWGFNTPLSLHGGATATFIEYVTTQLSAVTPPSAQVSVSASSLAFGDVPVGTSSASQSVTITSTGEVPYQINSFGSTPNCQANAFCNSADFVCSTDCATAPTSYGMNASCHVSASFAPNTTGPQSAVIYICDNATGSPRSITLGGNGVPAPALSITPSSFDFGNVLVGARSPAATFTISNPGSTPASIGTISTLGDFALDFIGCGSSVPVGGSCTVRVVFAPTLPGRANGWLVVPDGATSAQTRAALLGSAIQEARLNAPASVDLGTYTLGTAPISQIVPLTNIGNAVVTLGRASVTSPFTLETDCPLNIMPGQSCSLRFGFSSTQTGDFRGSATIESNAVGGALSIALSARAVPAPVPIVHVSPTLIGFGDRIIGTVSPPQRVTVTNEGNAPAILTAITISNDFVVVSSTCGATLLPTLTCFVDVAMRPLSAGPVGGQLLVNSNAQGSPATVDLAGRGCRPFSMPGNRLGSRGACSP